MNTSKSSFEPDYRRCSAIWLGRHLLPNRSASEQRIRHRLSELAHWRTIPRRENDSAWASLRLLQCIRQIRPVGYAWRLFPRLQAPTVAGQALESTGRAHRRHGPQQRATGNFDTRRRELDRFLALIRSSTTNGGCRWVVLWMPVWLVHLFLRMDV